MKKLVFGFVTFLALLFVAPLVTPADAQVVVRLGPHHRHYHHRHAYYRHGHRYYR